MLFFANRSSRHAARLGPALTAHPVGVPAARVTPPHWLCRNRRQGEQTVRTGNPFKLALCLALAIPFALAACGGGGGGAPAKTAMTPPESPPETGGMEEEDDGGMDNGGMGERAPPTPPVARTPATGDLAIKDAIERVFKTDTGRPIINRPVSYFETFSATWAHTLPDRIGDEDGPPDQTTTNPITIREHAIYNALNIYSGDSDFGVGVPNYSAARHADRKRIFDALAFTKHSEHGDRWTKYGVHLAETNETCSVGLPGSGCIVDYPNRDNPDTVLREYDRVSAVGYLDYSAFFLTRHRLINKGYGYDTSLYDLSLFSKAHSTGLATPPATVAPTATWKGGMLASHHQHYVGRERLTLAESRLKGMLPLITGDVTLTMDIQQTYPITIAFENVRSSQERYDNWTWKMSSYSGGDFGYSDTEDGSILYGRFYGSNFEEAGGAFRRVITLDDEGDPLKYMDGAFGVRRQ